MLRRRGRPRRTGARRDRRRRRTHARAGQNIDSVVRSDLNDAAFAPLVAQWGHELRQGRGFVLIRGFPVECLDPESVELAYFTLGMQLGQRVGKVLLVPATMALIGDHNWYLPRWLERRLPDVHFSH